jgi:hypothetical protein
VAATVPKDLKKIFREAERQGWRIRETSDGFQLYAPDGVNIVTVHRTPGKQRVRQEILTKMRRYGFRWEDR